MVEYYHNQGGFYFELLHEIIHGWKMGATMIQKPVEFQVWTLFSEEIDYDMAPKYVPNALDRKMPFWKDKDLDKD